MSAFGPKRTLNLQAKTPHSSAYIRPETAGRHAAVECGARVATAAIQIQLAFASLLRLFCGLSLNSSEPFNFDLARSAPL